MPQAKAGGCIPCGAAATNHVGVSVQTTEAIGGKGGAAEGKLVDSFFTLMVRFCLTCRQVAFIMRRIK